MKGRISIYFSIFFLLSFTIFIYSCSKLNERKYVKQIQANLAEYDSVTIALISKYSNLCRDRGVIIYPSGERSLTGTNQVNHTITRFCNRNDIGSVRIECQTSDTSSKNYIVTYFLGDDNYQYVFNSKGNNRDVVFENTRVLTIPINNKWVFQYEKPNF